MIKNPSIKRKKCIVFFTFIYIINKYLKCIEKLGTVLIDK